MSEKIPQANPVKTENPLRAEKRRKLTELRAAGINPYPYSYDRNASLAGIREQYDSKLQTGEKLLGAGAKLGL